MLDGIKKYIKDKKEEKQFKDQLKKEALQEAKEELKAEYKKRIIEKESKSSSGKNMFEKLADEFKNSKTFDNSGDKINTMLGNNNKESTQTNDRFSNDRLRKML